MNSDTEAALNGFFSTLHVMTHRSRQGRVRPVKRDECMWKMPCLGIWRLLHYLLILTHSLWSLNKFCRQIPAFAVFCTFLLKISSTDFKEKVSYHTPHLVLGQASIYLWSYHELEAIGLIRYTTDPSSLTNTCCKVSCTAKLARWNFAVKSLHPS